MAPELSCVNHICRFGVNQFCRELTPRQLALWKAVQQARAQGLSLREISRQLGVHRNTVRKYARSLSQPTNRPINRGASRSPQPTINRSD